MKKLLSVLPIFLLCGILLFAQNSSKQNIVAEVSFTSDANNPQAIEGATKQGLKKIVFTPSKIALERFPTSGNAAAGTFTYMGGIRVLQLGPKWSTANVAIPTEYITITAPVKSEITGAITLETNLVVANKSWIDMDCNLIVQYSTSNDPTWMDVTKGGNVALDKFGINRANIIPVSAKVILKGALAAESNISFRIFVDKEIPGPKNSNVGIFESLKIVNTAK